MSRTGKLLLGFMVVCFLAPLSAYADFSAALGPEAGRFWEKTGGGGKSASSEVFSPGGAISVYSIEEGAVLGFFGHFSFLVPVSLTRNGKDIGLGFYNVLLQAAILAGPGFRFNLNDALRLNLGAGAHALYLAATAETDHDFYEDYRYSRSSVNLGVGADVELAFKIFSALYIAAGAAVTYDFFNHTQSSSPQHNNGGRAAEYTMLGVRAYLCVGWRFEDAGED